MAIGNIFFLLCLLFRSIQIPVMVKTLQASNEVEMTNILNISNGIINLLIAKVLTKADK